MAYALALSCATDFPEVGPIILIDTLLYAFTTILVQGSSMYSVLVRCDVKQKPLELNDLTSLRNSEGRESCCNRLKNWVRRFDTKYFAPIFIRNKLIQNRTTSTMSSEFAN